MKTYHLMGTCHIDLAWHGDESMYACYLEQFTVILLDLMEQYPEMTYMIEQAYHYRSLEKRRPDLVRRLRSLVESGRIEVVGGMASTMDSNMPCGESLIRNQLLGMRWFQRHLGAEIQTGWLVDAFGSNAQIPQIMRSFGLKEMMATRFGGKKAHDVFVSNGLNGQTLLTAGRDCFSPNLPGPECSRVFFEFVQTGRQIDAAYERIKKARLDGPILADLYVEDETYPNSRMARGAYDLMRYAESKGNQAFFSLPRDFFRQLRETNADFPVESADLNPEFTGTYANRVEIKLENRKTETALLNAEKWLALLAGKASGALREAWWDMAFVHFHDVFTGSTPDCVYQDVLSRLLSIQSIAADTMETLFRERKEGEAFQVINSLPFERAAWVSVPCGHETEYEVSGAPSYCTNGKVWFFAQVPPCASRIYRLTEKQAPSDTRAEENLSCVVLENEFIRLVADANRGISLYDRGANRFLLKETKDLLVLQREEGNFQIENICGPEQAAWASPVTIQQSDAYQAAVSGVFADRGQMASAEWEIVFSLRPREKSLGVQIKVRWMAEGKRLRLKLRSELRNTGSCICEIPFGAVTRSAYAPGFCQKGEWPVQRFALLEDEKGGLALINTGVPGVEILGRSLYTTLLRSPTAAYAGMVPDDTSSQHGTHTFSFALYPYSGPWQESGALRLAQEWNDPLLALPCDEKTEPISSLLSVSAPNVVLHAVKLPEKEDESKEVILHLAEQTGRNTECGVTLRNACRAWRMNLKEEKEEEIPLRGGALRLRFSPWQILTICVERTEII